MTGKEDSAEALLDMVYGCWKSQAIHAFAHFNLADLLSVEPKSSVELAERTNTHQPALFRLLNAARSIGLVRKISDDLFELTGRGRLLISDAPDSVRHWTLWWGNALWPVWGNLVYSLETGLSARAKLLGSEGFKHLEDDPEAAHTFNLGIAEVTRLAAKNIVSEFDFSRFALVMDLGGGYGQLLASILEANPQVRGLLFDLPEAIAGTDQFWRELPFNNRCQRIRGDFFSSIPTEADAVILKSVLHDWKEADAMRILRTCRRDMKAGSSLLVIERLIPDELEESSAHQAIARNDLAMLVAHGSGERSEGEYRRMLETAGFEIIRIVATHSGFSILESK